MVSADGKLIGLIQNKHLPPHNGHKYMCDWSLAHLKTRAQRQGQEHHLYVMVCSRDEEVINGKLRYEWTKKILADQNVTVLHAHNVHKYFPEYGNDYGNHEMWGRAAREMLGLGDQVDYLYASENYGPGIAAACGAEFISCDKDRTTLPVSGTEIREHPHENWHYIPAVVRPFFQKKVCVYGDNQITEHLANHFNTLYIPDYAGKICSSSVRTIEDIESIVEHHLAAEEALLQQANKLLLGSNDLLAATLESYQKFGSCPAWIEKEARQKRYDLYLLPEEVKQLGEELDQRDWQYIILKGDTQRRMQDARIAVNAMYWNKEVLQWRKA